MLLCTQKLHLNSASFEWYRTHIFAINIWYALYSNKWIQTGWKTCLWFISFLMTFLCSRQKPKVLSMVSLQPFISVVFFRNFHFLPTPRRFFIQSDEWQKWNEQMYTIKINNQVLCIANDLHRNDSLVLNILLAHATLIQTSTDNYFKLKLKLSDVKLLFRV